MRREVLAFYYRGRGNPSITGRWVRWQGPTGKEAPEEDPVPDFPVLGMYDSHDPAVLAQHARWLRQAGCTGVILGAWSRDLWEDRDGGAKTLAAMAAQGLKFSVYLEGQKAGLEGAKADLRYLHAHGMQSPSWLRIGGRPVLFLYRRAFRDLPSPQWREAAKALAADGAAEPMLIGDLDPSDPAFPEKAQALDGAHFWSVAELIAGKTPPEMAAPLAAAYAATAHAAPGKLSCATVMPGWNDTRITKRPYPRPTTDRFGTATLEALWTAAQKLPADYVLINAFNGWHNGAEIEPSREWGESALDANARHARRFLEHRA